jgi:hypothetical protein
MDKIFRYLGGDNKPWRFGKYIENSIGIPKKSLEDSPDVDTEPFFMTG